MTALLWQFFNVLGVDMVPPSNFAAFVPWFMQVLLGVAVVACVFKFFFAVPSLIFRNGGRW